MRAVRGVAVFLLVIAVALAGLYFYQDRLQRIGHPLRYEELVVENAEANRLDPLLVWSVMKVESGFREKAESRVGARGLMQVMPDTGEWIAKKLGEQDGYTDDRLYEAETSLRYGCWYLRYLLDRFDGELTLSIAAYNAGGGNVDKWLDDARYSQDGEALTHIPFAETRQYVQRIEKAYAAYQRLYPEIANAVRD